MSNIIEEFYIQYEVKPILIEHKMVKLNDNPDIKSEFEYWIKNGMYKPDNELIVEGYTASGLAKISEYLNGEGAFMMLIELRENPKAAIRKISDGFKIK